MSPIAQNVVYTSLVISALVALAAIADFIFGAPFGGQTVFDVMAILGAGLIGFLGFDCIKNAG